MGKKHMTAELTRERIMDASRELLVKQGYERTSIRQIAKQLNCSHGSIYYYFKNKAELFYALVENHFALLEQKMDDILHASLPKREKLHKLLLGYIQFGLENQSQYEIMFLIKDEEVLQFLNKGPSKTYDKFAQSIQKLSGQQASIQSIYSIFLSLHGFVTHYLRHVVRYEEVEEMANFHVGQLLKIIETE